MPNMPLFQCTEPGCNERQKASRCPKHQWQNAGYEEYRRNRRILLTRHINRHGLKCPGAEGHEPHLVLRRGDLTADHIVPRSHGGGHELTNLRVLCGRWNSVRGAAPVPGYHLQATGRSLTRTHTGRHARPQGGLKCRSIR